MWTGGARVWKVGVPGLRMVGEFESDGVDGLYVVIRFFVLHS